MKPRPCALKRTEHGKVACELDWDHAGAHVGRGANRRKFVWWHTCGGIRPIPFDRMSEYLPLTECVDAVGMAMEELAIATSLRMIHGEARAAQIYEERGGHVRFKGEGEESEMWLLWPGSPKTEAAA